MLDCRQWQRHPYGREWLESISVMTKGIKKAYDTMTDRQKQQVEQLMTKWSIKRSDAVRLALGREPIDSILLKYDRRPDGRTIYRTLGSGRGSHDALTRRLPGSFENASK